ncbi:hypothetical protein A5671_03285 [Mycolicibacter heraklionensis]|nr:hypothetical protein A5671_03285 [Mycolicibacter heraklionensis]
MRGHARLVDDSGASTVEAAFALAALVSVLVLCLAGITAVSAQIRCVDAAREAARLAARGDAAAVTAVVGQIAPDGAAVITTSSPSTVQLISPACIRDPSILACAQAPAGPAGTRPAPARAARSAMA